MAAGLKAFIAIPKDIREWTRWIKEALIAGSVGTDELEDGAVTFPKLANLAARSVIGNATAASAVPAAISAAADDRILSRTAGTLAFTQLTSGMFPNAVVPDAALSSSIGLASTGSFTATLTGVVGTVTTTFSYAKTGSVVSLMVRDLSGTSNTTASTITGAPAAIWPANSQTCIIRVTDNSLTSTGIATISAAGTITLSPTMTGGLFTAAGTKGVALSAMTYPLT